MSGVLSWYGRDICEDIDDLVSSDSKVKDVSESVLIEYVGGDDELRV